MTDIRKKTVLITGGARGIGHLVAARCLERGAGRMILWDIDEAALDGAVQAFREQGHDVEGYVVDLADPAQIAEVAREIIQSGSVHILVNNAGVVVGKTLVEHTPDDIENSIRINVLGVMHVTRAFLPAMILRGKGHIVNMASASGYIPVPRLATYAASKWACLGFSESLRVELKPYPDLHVSTICPSYTKTGMFEGVRAPMLAPLLEPGYVAERIVRAIEGNRHVLPMPWIVRIVPVLYHALPTPLFDLVCGRLFGIYRSMDRFTGRGEHS